MNGLKKGLRFAVVCACNAGVRRRLIWMMGCLLLSLILPFSARASVAATGGNVTNDFGPYRVHLFTETGEHTLTVHREVEAEILVVGGGGGGGQVIGGGGGGGGVIHSNSYSLVISNYTVIVGVGAPPQTSGSGSTYPAGLKGEDSVFGSLTAIGGAGGAGYNANATDTGGSGGGDAANTGKGGEHTEGQGHDGGTGLSNNFGGGGGGAGTAGTNAVTGFAGDGGAGLAFDISGSLVYYGGGGGGGVRNSSHGLAGKGGIGGGGDGGNTVASNGVANTGGGGGSSGWESSFADAGGGGSGIVIVRYLNVIASDPLEVVIHATTGIGGTNATLKGWVGGFGGEDAPHIYFCWGTADGGIVSTGNWQQVAALGNDWSPSDALSHEIFGLDMGQDYFVRVYATNSAGDTAWSGLEEFTTIDVPAVIQDGVSQVGRYASTLHGEVTATGGETPLTGFEWWPAVAGTPTTTVSVGYQDGIFDAEVSGLSPDTEYVFRAWASNVAGQVWSVTDSFTTLDMSPRTNIWTGAVDNDWFTEANWDPGSIPGDGLDTARLTNGTILLTAATDSLAAFEMTGGTLTFSNWNTSLSATTVDISGGSVTCAGPYVNNAMSNRVWIICNDLTVGQNASINVNSKGYAGGYTVDKSSYNGHGQAGGPGNANGVSGGGHGGRGGSGYATGMTGTYGDMTAPTAPGSGGGGQSAYGGGTGGHGGGAILVDATGTVTVEGLLSANGSNASGPNREGGGSGGSIWITCTVFQGTNGSLTVNAGNSSGTMGGGGGGGRIAVIYDTDAQAGNPRPQILFSARPGTGRTEDAGLGSIYLPDGSILDPEWMPHSGIAHIPGFNTWDIDSLTVTNGRFVLFGSPGLIVTVTNDVTITGSGTRFIIRDGKIACETLTVTNGASMYLGFADTLRNDPATNHVTTVTCAGDLIIAPNSTLGIYSAPTNGVNTDFYGSLIDVGGDLRIYGGARLIPYSAQINGASPLLRMRNLYVANEGLINANGLGFAGSLARISAGYGPGRGSANGDNNSGGGGGYGGMGGNGVTAGGNTYGSALTPIYPGSGGGSGVGAAGRGGGLVRVEARETVTLDGTITANGSNGNASQLGGGSGGGIYIVCQEFKGAATGIMRANGGSGGGGGGGGRIAVWYGDVWTTPTIPDYRKLESDDTAPGSYAGAFPTATLGAGGNHQSGVDGTVRFIRVLKPFGTLFQVR